MRHYILAFSFFILGAFAAFGQRTATDTTKKVIFKKNAEVRFYMGTKGDGSDAVPLFVNLKSPVRLTSSGKYTMTHLDLKLGKKIPFEVYADGQAPQTGFGIVEVDKGKDNIHHVKPPCIITFSASDDLSGLESIFVSLDGAPYFECIDTIALTEEKLHIVRFFSIDKVGNREKTSEIKVLVDGTPPVSNLEIRGDRSDNTISARSSVALLATDNHSVKKTVYKIDDGQEFRYGMPLKASTFAEGEHTISYFSEDFSGNREEPKEFTFFVDKSAPIVFVEIVGNSYVLNGKSYSSGRSQLQITAVDNKAGVNNIFYTINGNKAVEYTKPVYLSELIGSLSITAFATDKVNNKTSENNDNQLSNVPSVDISGPSVSHRFVGNKIFRNDTLFISPSTRIFLDGRDTESGLSHIVYRMDGAEEQTFDKPFAVTAEGNHAIAYTGFDNVENINSGKGAFFVDATGPEIAIIFGQRPIGKSADGLDIYPSTLTLFLGATDAITGTNRLFYSLNAATKKPYGMPISEFKHNQNYVMKVEAFDILGNTTFKEVRFAVGE